MTDDHKGSSEATTKKNDSLGNTRIIVKSLPKYLTEQKLKDHFSQFGFVTDARIMKTKDGKTRQFGFVGFRNASEATKALAANNTYLDTTRIIVELARPIGPLDEKLLKNPELRPWSKYSKGSSAYEKKHNNERNAKKKEEKRNVLKEKVLERIAKTKGVENSQELKDFLAAEKARSQQKFWANDLELPNADATIEKKKMKTEVGDAVVVQKAVESRKPGGKGIFLKKTHVKFADSEHEYEDLKKSNDDESESEDEDEDKKKNSVAFNQALSDMDYLKSKVSKKLDEEEADSDSEDENEDESDDNSSESDNKANGNEPNEAKTKKAKTTKTTASNKSSAEDMEIDEAATEPTADDDETKDTKEGQSKADDSDSDDDAANSGRLFVKNLPYLATEEDVIELFSQFGTVVECHIPIDKDTHKSKGIAFVLFAIPEDAVKAMKALNDQVFQGRILSITSAKKPPFKKIIPEIAAKSSYKQQKEKELRESASNTQNWNTLYMRSDTVAESVAKRLDISAGSFLNPFETDSAAVNIAMAETEVVKETKKILMEEGIDLSVLNDPENFKKRSKTMILVKNLPHDADKDELQKMFAAFGTISRVVMPPSRAICLVEFTEPTQARTAFRRLAYKRYKSAPIFLEFAPQAVLATKESIQKQRDQQKEEQKKKIAKEIEEQKNAEAIQKQKSEAAERLAKKKEEKTKSMDQILQEQQERAEESDTLYVKNLNFITTPDTLRRVFAKYGEVIKVNLALRNEPGAKQRQSLGYGFIKFASVKDAKNALRQAQGFNVDGHSILLGFSQAKDKPLTSSTPSAAIEPQPHKDTPVYTTKDGATVTFTKLVVKNLAFEATAKELQDLFGAYGEIKEVRLPKKVSDRHKGYAFIDFATPQEAHAAMEALKHTHLYGRHLVIDFAKDQNSMEALREKTTKLWENEKKRKREN